MSQRSHVRRSYTQYCALARAFDVIGERWTPLLVRELAFGPRRYADLLEGLPGIGTSLLASRLRELEAAGIVEQRRLPPPAARNVYALTDDGVDLYDALRPLARWGAKRLGRRGKDETFRLEWFLMYLETAFDRDAAAGVHDVYEFHVDGDVLHATVDDGAAHARLGPAPQRADLVLTADLDTFAAIAGGDSNAARRVRVEGDADAARRCLAIFAGS
jgi:DNA-binding HxlR family transcriptional regulator